ncbi:Lactonase, 7-bladed beta-propeller-domain-containing protein [Cryomyces antarcticus]
MLNLPFLIATAAGVCSATNLFVASYAGNITTLSLTERKGAYQLQKTHYNQGCGPNPSWLTLDFDRSTLYCMDEGLTVPNGSLSSYHTSPDGMLTQIQKAATISSPVSGVIFGDASGQRAIALAHYTGAVSSWALGENGTFKSLQEITFNLTKPGPNLARQSTPHEHEAILDPTGQFVIMPDLGADLVRVFSYMNGTLSEHTPLKVVAGSGPRYAAFYSPYGVACEGCTTFLYVVTELGNTVTSYAVTYPMAGGLAFKEVYKTSVYGNLTLPTGNAAAEIAVSPDNRFLVVSDRNNTSFKLANPDPKNSTKIPSDSLSTFALQHDGSLIFEQLWPAGGSYPRHFSVNRYGDLVAVGLQYSSRVVIMKRDVQTGLIGNAVASVEVDGQVTCVVWDE